MSIFNIFKKNDNTKKRKIYNLLSSFNIKQTELLFYIIFEKYKNDHIIQFELSHNSYYHPNLNEKINIFFSNFTYFRINNYTLDKNMIYEIVLDQEYSNLGIQHFRLGSYCSEFLYVRANGLFLYSNKHCPDMASPEFEQDNIFSNFIVEILLQKYQHLSDTDFLLVIKTDLNL